MNKPNNPCEHCEIYINKREELLRAHNSAFGAAAEMWYFIQECEKTCNKKEQQDNN